MAKEISTTSSGLVAYYKFENNANDSTANALNGSAVGVTYDRNIKFLGDYSLKIAAGSSSASRITISHNALFNVGSTSDFSIEFYMKHSNAVVTSSALMNKADGSAIQSSEIILNPDGLIYLHIGQDLTTGNRYIFSNKNVNDGQWHHVIFVRRNSGTVLEVWIDGILDNTNIGSAVSPDGLGPLYIGGASAGFGGTFVSFDGFIDEFKWWSVAKTPYQFSSAKTDYFGTNYTNRIKSVITNNSSTIELPVNYPLSFDLKKAYTTDANTQLLCHFDQTSGTSVTDNSGNSRTGTINGTSALWRIKEGRFNNSLEFDGTTNYVNYGNVINFGAADSFTIEAWIKPFSADANGRGIITKKFLPGGDPRYELTFKSTAVSFIIEGTGTSSAVFTVDTTKWFNQWHHVAGVRDVPADKIYLYVDGIKVAEATDNTTATLSSTANLVVGADSVGTAGTFFNGQIDEVRISNVIKTSFVDDVISSSKRQADWADIRPAYNKENILVDNFNDNDYTTNPVWTADAGTWTFSSGQLQIATNSARLSTHKYVSSTPLDLSFKYKCNAAADGGLVSFYSDSVAITGSVTQYYLYMNENDNENIVLYKIVSGTQTALITTANSVLVTDTLQKIRLTRDFAGLFTLYVDGTSVGTTTDTSITSGKYVTLGTDSTGTKTVTYDDFLFQTPLTYHKTIPYALQGVGEYSGTEQGLLGLWHLNEISGTTAYDSVSANNGTLTNGAAPISSGKYNYGVSLDGTNDYITFGNVHNFGASDSFTVEMWFNPTSITGEVFLFQKSNASTGYELRISTTAITAFLQGTGTTTLALTIDPTKWYGQWHHIAVVRNTGADTFSMILDGVQVASVTDVTTTTLSNIGALVFGASTAGASPFNGKIDEISIWNYPKTAEELRAENPVLMKIWAKNQSPIIASGNDTYYLYHGGD